MNKTGLHAGFKRLAAAAALVTVLCMLCGCAGVTVPLWERYHGNVAKSSVAGRLAAQVGGSEADIPASLRNVPVHSNAVRFASNTNGVTPEIDEDNPIVQGRVGIEYAIETRWVRLRLGVDFTYHGSGGDSYDEVTQPLTFGDETYDSYGGYVSFTVEHGDALQPEPFVGLDLKLGRAFFLAEYAQPSAEYALESGYIGHFDTKGNGLPREARQRGTWESDGERFSVGVGYRAEADDLESTISIVFTQETFEPEFHGTKATVENRYGMIMWRIEL